MRSHKTAEIIGRRVCMIRHGLLVMAILASILGCRASQEPAIVPTELHGLWTTTDSRYENRSFELRADTIALATGEKEHTSHPIQKFERIQEKGTTVYSLTYGNVGEGVTDTLSFYYDPREGGVITFKNQRNVAWKKGSAS